MRFVLRGSLFQVRRSPGTHGLPAGTRSLGLWLERDSPPQTEVSLLARPSAIFSSFSFLDLVHTEHTGRRTHAQRLHGAPLPPACVQLLVRTGWGVHADAAHEDRWRKQVLWNGVPQKGPCRHLGCCQARTSGLRGHLVSLASPSFMTPSSRALQAGHWHCCSHPHL